MLESVPSGRVVEVLVKDGELKLIDPDVIDALCVSDAVVSVAVTPELVSSTTVLVLLVVDVAVLLATVVDPGVDVVASPSIDLTHPAAAPE